MSEQPNPGRKAIVLLAAVVLVCLTLWVARGASILSGASPAVSPAETKAADSDTDAGKGVTTTTTADQPPGK
jgi:hypothetical protein